MICANCEEECKTLIRFEVQKCDRWLTGRKELSLCPDCYCGFAAHKYVSGFYPSGFIDLDRYYRDTHELPILKEENNQCK